MGLHMVNLLKLHLQLARPAVAGFSSIVLMLKLLMGFRFFKDEALYQSRLFLFRLSQIVFDRETPLSNIARMERALRLVFPSASSEYDEQIGQDTFHALSMVAL